MKKTLLFFLLITVFGLAKAQFEYDTITHQAQGPGIIYTELHAPDEPLWINVLVIDLTNPYSSIETVCSNDKMPDMARETTSSMTQRNTYEGHKVVGAVNGDFFSYDPGNSLGMQVRNGEIIKSYGGSQGISFDVNDKPVVGKPNYDGTLHYKDESIKIDGVNIYEGDLHWFSWLEDNRLLLFNQYYGSTVNLNEGETKAVIQAIDDWVINDEPVRCIIKEISADNVSMSDGESVLFGLGTGADFINDNLTVGDTVLITNHITDLYSHLGISQPEKLRQHIGGYPRFILHGKDYVDEGVAEMNANIDKAGRQPRTAIGFSKDSTKLYFVTIDGRQSGYSIGVSMYELAEFMISIGVHTGINMDSGGSTTMVINNEVVNSPSDGNERKVINALTVAASAPDGYLSLFPKKTKLLTNQTEHFMFNIWNNDAPIDSSQLSFTISEGLGTIAPNGLFTASGEPAQGFVYLDYQGKTDSAFVMVKSYDSLLVTPSEYLTDDENPVDFTAQVFDSEGMEVNLSVEEFEWSSSNPAVGTVDDTGHFTGLANGEVYVKATYQGVADSALVSVEIGEETGLLDGMESPDGWTFDKENMNSVDISVVQDEPTQGSSCFKIDYEFTFTDEVPAIFLKKDIRVFGIPDSIWLDARFNGKEHRITYYLSDNDGNYIIAPVYFSHYSFSKPYGGKLGKNVDVHPLTFNQVRIDLKKNDGYTDGETYSGTIYVDNLRVSYKGHTPIETAIETIHEGDFDGMKCYPNPFENTVNIRFVTEKEGAEVSLSVFDITGKKVATLVAPQKLPKGVHSHVWNAARHDTGLYICKLMIDGKTIVKKVVNKK